MGVKNERQHETGDIFKGLSPKHPISRREYLSRIRSAASAGIVGALGIYVGLYIRETSRKLHEEEAEIYCKNEYKISNPCKENSPVLFASSMAQAGIEYEFSEGLGVIEIGLSATLTALGTGDMIAAVAERTIVNFRGE